MLINSVVLFLRDMLPIFLLISVLISLPRVSQFSLLWRIAILLIISTTTYSMLGLISQQAEGAGFELLKSLLLFLAWLGICMISLPLRSGHKLYSLGITLVVLGIGLSNSFHFMVYFVSGVSQNSDTSLLILGTTIGLGISISIAILLNIMLTHFIGPKATFYFTTLFVAAQVANVAILLEQIDILPAPQQLWDSSHIISDNSEYGHLLNALVGYEATPSLSYILIFIWCLTFPNVIYFLKRNPAALLQQTEGSQ